MKKEYTIPELLGLMQVKGYSENVTGAVNTLLNTQDKITYKEALEVATKEITGYKDVKFVEHNDSAKSFRNDVTFFNNGGVDYGTNIFGMPIYQPLILEGVKGVADGKDLVLESAIVEINKSKEIVVTKIQGQEKSVKEHISDGDWQIKVSGMISQMGPGYPLDQVKKYNAFMSLNEPLSITHEVLNMMGITEIVITGVEYPSSTFNNAQVYGFSALDDEPLIVKA